MRRKICWLLIPILLSSSCSQKFYDIHKCLTNSSVEAHYGWLIEALDNADGLSALPQMPEEVLFAGVTISRPDPPKREPWTTNTPEFYDEFHRSASFDYILRFKRDEGDVSDAYYKNPHPTPENNNLLRGWFKKNGTQTSALLYKKYSDLGDDTFKLVEFTVDYYKTRKLICPDVETISG